MLQFIVHFGKRKAWFQGIVSGFRVSYFGFRVWVQGYSVIREVFTEARVTDSKRSSNRSPVIFLLKLRCQSLTKPPLTWHWQLFWKGAVPSLNRSPIARNARFIRQPENPNQSISHQGSPCYCAVITCKLQQSLFLLHIVETILTWKCVAAVTIQHLTIRMSHPYALIPLKISSQNCPFLQVIRLFSFNYFRGPHFDNCCFRLPSIIHRVVYNQVSR